MFGGELVHARPFLHLQGPGTTAYSLGKASGAGFALIFWASEHVGLVWMYDSQEGDCSGWQFKATAQEMDGIPHSLRFWETCRVQGACLQLGSRGDSAEMSPLIGCLNPGLLHLHVNYPIS